MAKFGDLKSDAGVKALNEYLADNSYLNGYEPSQDDVATLKQVGKAPAAAKFPHAARWYRHLSSYSDKQKAAFGSGTGASGDAKPAPAKADDDDDDVDLFGSDDEEEDEAAQKVREERLKAYEAKKSKKPALIAKSSVLLDVKPWDDETDMKEMEKQVRTIEMDGLVWGASKLVPVGYGINKLQIMCVVEDDKVSVDLLTEEIQNFEDFVQSVDIAAFSKI